MFNYIVLGIVKAHVQDDSALYMKYSDADIYECVKISMSHL